MEKLEPIMKLVLAILFFICLLDMPYGYFQMVRFLALVGFSLLAYYAHQREEKSLVIIYVGLAILFQPFIKISLGRSLWNVVDVIVGVWLLVDAYRSLTSTDNKA